MGISDEYGTHFTVWQGGCLEILLPACVIPLWNHITGRKSQICVTGRSLFSCSWNKLVGFTWGLGISFDVDVLQVKFQNYYSCAEFAVQNEPHCIMYALSQSGVHHCKPSGVLLGQLSEKNKEIVKVVTKEVYPLVRWTSDCQTSSGIRNAYLFQ